MPNPVIEAAHLSRTPVEADNRCCKRLARLLLLPFAILGHRNHEAWRWTHDGTRVCSHDCDRAAIATLTILRQPLGKKDVRVDPLGRCPLRSHSSLRQGGRGL